MFPKLDAGVVAAALQAGIPMTHLESMQSLMAQHTKATKVKDMNPKVAPDPLSENEGDSGRGRRAAARRIWLGRKESDRVNLVQVDFYCGVPDRREEEVCCEQAGDRPGRWGDWLIRSPVVWEWEKGSSSSQSPAIFLRRAPRRYIGTDREADVRGPHFDIVGSRHASSRAECTSLGGASQPYHCSQDRGPCSLERSRNLGQPHLGSLHQSEGQMCGPFTDAGSGKYRPRQLDPCSRAGFGAGAANECAEQSCGAGSARWRESFQQAVGCEMGGSSTGTPQGPGRLPGEEAQCGKGAKRSKRHGRGRQSRRRDKEATEAQGESKGSPGGLSSGGLKLLHDGLDTGGDRGGRKSPWCSCYHYPSQSFFEFNAQMDASNKMHPSEFFALYPDDAPALSMPYVDGGFYLAAAAPLS